MLIWRILRGPGNTEREAPALLPEPRAIVDSCATSGRSSAQRPWSRLPDVGKVTIACFLPGLGWQ